MPENMKEELVEIFKLMHRARTFEDGTAYMTSDGYLFFREGEVWTDGDMAFSIEDFEEEFETSRQEMQELAADYEQRAFRKFVALFRGLEL